MLRVCFLPKFILYLLTKTATTIKTKDNRGWLKRPPKPTLTKNAVSKPITTPIAINVQVEWSIKTYPKCFNTGENLDICINVFYNGEFAHSRVYRAETVRNSTAEEKQPNFSGMRVDFKKEVPFIVLPLNAGLAKTTQRRAVADLDQGWKTINTLLLAEAQQWGRHGKYDQFRSPVGEYLEEISNMPMPEDLAKTRDGDRNIGIIDVSSSFLDHYNVA